MIASNTFILTILLFVVPKSQETTTTILVGKAGSLGNSKSRARIKWSSKKREEKVWGRARARQGFYGAPKREEKSNLLEEKKTNALLI